jgi:hypothetical protein
MAEVHLVVHGLHGVLAPAYPFQPFARAKRGTSKQKEESVSSDTTLAVRSPTQQPSKRGMHGGCQTLKVGPRALHVSQCKVVPFCFREFSGPLLSRFVMSLTWHATYTARTPFVSASACVTHQGQHGRVLDMHDLRPIAFNH